MKVPPGVQERIKRGRDRMREGAPERNECLAFSRGEQYKWVDSKNSLRSQATTADYTGKGKPRHRVRTTRNFIFDIIENEVSYATQRVPSYEVLPSGTDPQKISAARLAQKAAYYGYDKFKVRAVTEEVVRYAVVADEGFAWPYFDNTVGPYLQDGEETIGQGEICIRTYGPNEVCWEPGLSFAESRWHAIEQARDIEAVMETEGYVGGKLDPNAKEAESDLPQSQLVLVTEYLERPSKSNPNGRWLTIANEKVIVEERPYPCVDHEGKVLDEPVLHKLCYSTDPGSDRDQGLVRHLLDAQRSVNHSVNKITEWINLALNPQVIIQNGEFKQKLTDEPGAVYHAVGTGEIKFRQVPQVPSELFQQKQEGIQDMARIAAQNDIPSQVESGRGIQALIERDQTRRANFLANLAEFHSRLMRQCLYLVQRHYTEERLLKIRGRFGPELIPDFLGAELLGEADIRVSPGSLEPRSRASIEQKILAFADKGWISPHAAMAAINGGTAESLVESYELDVARTNLVIQKIKEGPDVLLNTPPRRPFPGEEPGVDPETGMAFETVPGWMPRRFDKVAVQRSVLEDWMKTTEYDDLDPPAQEAANMYYSALLEIEAQQNAEAAEAQAQMAESLGMKNAGKPQTPPPLPDQKELSPNGLAETPA